jgi:O-antigen ligase
LLVGPPDPPDVFEGTLLQEPIGYANGLGGLAAIGLVVALTLLARERRRPFLVLLLALFAVTLVWTGSRAGIVAAAVGGALGLALALGRLRLARLVVGAAGLALALALALPAGSLADDLARHGGDRPWYWHVAWEEVRVAPLAGQGAGTFHLSWLELRPIDASVQDAHSLYLEMLAELGAVGLALLLLALGPPLVVALRGARFPAAAAGYVAFLFHAGVDWDWELPAVTVAGLLCGAQLLRPNAQDRERENVSTGEPAKGVS